MTSDAWIKEQNNPFMLSDTQEDHIHIPQKILHNCALKAWLSNPPRTKTYLQRREAKKVTFFFLFFSCAYKIFLFAELQLATVTKIKDTTSKK